MVLVCLTFFISDSLKLSMLSEVLAPKMVIPLRMVMTSSVRSPSSHLK